MAKGTRICKVCGQEYEYCHTVRDVSGTFRYQDVACSPDHGAIYLARVMAARGEAPVVESVVEPVSEEVERCEVLQQEEPEAELDNVVVRSEKKAHRGMFKF